MSGRSGRLIAFAAPSGGGKSTIAQAILQRHPDIRFSVSATTRPMRPGEVNGREYFFLTKEEFERQIAENALVEWEFFFGNYYGTLRDQVDAALARNGLMLFDVDVKGALSIRRLYPDDAVLIFIEPPSQEVLQERLRGRKTESEEALRIRLERAAMEMELGKTFDYRVVNDNLQKAIAAVDDLVRRCKETSRLSK